MQTITFCHFKLESGNFWLTNSFSSILVDIYNIMKLSVMSQFVYGVCIENLKHQEQAIYMKITVICTIFMRKEDGRRVDL